MRRVLGCITTLFLLLAAGVVLALPASSAEVPLEAIAGGDQVVPGPGDPDGVAFGQFLVDDETNELCYRIAAFEVTLPATEVHIHEGAAGAEGDIAVTLDEAVVGDSFDEEACDTVDPTVADAIAADPSGFYFSISTSDFPDGALRGQLEVPLEPVIVGTDGDGGQVVPGPGDPEGTVAAAFTLFERYGLICGVIRAEDIALPAVAMDIHQGPTGQTGPVVVTLDPASIGTGTLTCAAADPAVLAAMADDPTGYYLDIHTDDFPEGAVRGQLEADADLEPLPPVTSPAAPTSTAALPRSVPAGSGGQAAVDQRGNRLGVAVVAVGIVLGMAGAVAWRRRGAQAGSA